MIKPSIKPVLLALALAAALPASQALTFQFNDVTAGGMRAEQLAAFNAAANIWSSRLSDPVTVYIDISFASLPPHVLGGTNLTSTSASYSTVRALLAADATSALDASAVAHLQAGPALTFRATQGDLTTRLDNDGSVNNQLLGVTTANAKAMGLAVATDAAHPDAGIQFGSYFDTNNAFSYSRAGGAAPGKYDFISVAEHEIGHALGFVSGVDDIDYCAGAANRCQLANPNSATTFENAAWYTPLDLFRYSANGVLDLRVGQAAYLSIDGGATAVASMSTGQFNGDGYQASHFIFSQLALMRPGVPSGVAYDLTAEDLAAMDAIGWNTSPVPEPQTPALMLLGLIGLAGLRARRRARR